MFGSKNKTHSGTTANTTTTGRNTHTSNTTGTDYGAPAKKASPLQKILRILQFLSALISLILFSIRINKIIRLIGRATHSNGAVEGILVAAVLYTLIATALQFALRAGVVSGLVRILLIVFDLLFVGAFIAVAVLTSPATRGSSAPCRNSSDLVIQHADSDQDGDNNCNLPWGTFLLAIFSILLHTATAIFHGIKDRRNKNKLAKQQHHETGGMQQQRY